MSGHKPKWKPVGGRIRTQSPFSIAEAAACIGLPVRVIYDMIDKGQLRSFASKGGRYLTRNSTDQLLKWREHLPQWVTEVSTPQLPQVSDSVCAPPAD